MAELEDKAMPYAALIQHGHLLMMHNSCCRSPERPCNTGQPRLMIVTRQVMAFSASPSSAPVDDVPTKLQSWSRSLV